MTWHKTQFMTKNGNSRALPEQEEIALATYNWVEFIENKDKTFKHIIYLLFTICVFLLLQASVTFHKDVSYHCVTSWGSRLSFTISQSL